MALNKKVRKLLRQFYKEHPRRVRIANVHHTINARSESRDILDRFCVDGKIGVHRSGMDCDCTQYYESFVMNVPNSAVLFLKMEEEHSNWLDGPETTEYDRPENITPRYVSRDRALEAYEEGHPHVVYMGDL